VGFDEPFRNRETEADSAMVIALRLPEIVEEVLEILLGPHQRRSPNFYSDYANAVPFVPGTTDRGCRAIRLIRAFCSLRADFANRSVGNLNKRINA